MPTSPNLITIKPNVWFSTTKPTSTYPYDLYIWEANGQLQAGITSEFSPTDGIDSRPFVTLRNPEQTDPNLGLYPEVIRKLVSAYKTNGLILEYISFADDPLPDIAPSVLNDLSTVKGYELRIRVDYEYDADDQLIMYVDITDAYGFVLAATSNIILTNVGIFSSIPTDNPYITAAPQSTAPLSQAGDFSAANPVLLPAKSAQISGQFIALQAYWYGMISTVTPTTMDSKQLAIWTDLDGNFKFGISVPADEILPYAALPVSTGVLLGLPPGLKCIGDKWWLILTLNESLEGVGADRVLLSKILAAANNGLLFMSTRFYTTDFNQIPSSYASYPGSITINYGMYLRQVPVNGVMLSEQRVIVRLKDYMGGPVIAGAMERTRFDCLYNTAILFPANNILYDNDPNININCTNGHCTNTALLEKFVPHGPNSGINVALGRGALPSITNYLPGINPVYWNLNKTVIPAETFVQHDPKMMYIHGNMMFMPYMGLEQTVHSNHAARAVLLGYTDYYYSEAWMPLDMCRTTNFSPVLGSAPHLSAFLATPTVIMSDDDDVQTIEEAEKGQYVLWCVPDYEAPPSTTQHTNKIVKFFTPNTNVIDFGFTMQSDAGLSLDLSKLRPLTPLFTTNYGKVIQDTGCLAMRVAGNIVYGDALAPCAANVYYGFSGSFADSSHQVKHTLKLPADMSTVTVLTGLTNYPEYAVPFTDGTAATSNAPHHWGWLYPTFVGKLPPNYKMLWVDWTSITATDITAYYWWAEEVYNMDTLYTTLPPTTDNAVAVVIPLTLAAPTAIQLDGTVLFSVELTERELGGANLRIYAGDMLVAEDTSGVFPLIRSGCAFFHADANSTDIEDVVFGAIEIVEGAKTSVLDTTVSRDYIELQLETVTTPITNSTYASMDLKPYTLYWDTVEKALYVPVLKDINIVPSQLAKSTFFSSQSSSHPLLVDLVDHGVPNEHIFLTNAHGLQQIPADPTAELFSSELIASTDESVSYYWRTGIDYSTTVGPLASQIVPGVVVPSKVITPATGTTSTMDEQGISTSSGLTFLGSNLVLTGVTDGISYVKFPLRLEDPAASKYTVQFVRKQTGTWQSSTLTSSNFGIYLYPSRPDYVGYAEYPLMPKPQIRAVRILFPMTSDAVAVQSSKYRGYDWNVAYTGIGSGILLGNNGESVFAIEVSDNGGMLSISIYENQILKYKVDTDIPYFNNGCIAMALENATYQASETLSDIDLVIGGPTVPSVDSTRTAYCVPTTSYSNEYSLAKDVATTVTTVSPQARYGYVDYTISNTGISAAIVKIHMSTGDISDVTLIDTVEIQPAKSVIRKLRYIHRNESLIAISTVEGIKLRAYTIVQL